jgi:hypothetical protein
MKRILPVLALAVIALAAVLVVNTLRFTSRQVADGYVWGRGAMDDKSGVLGIWRPSKRWWPRLPAAAHAPAGLRA